MADPQLPSYDDVVAASRLLGDRIHRTPCLSFQSAALEADSRLFLKCENLQKTGAFKARGALHYLLRLTDEQRAAGVLTYSSGNHGAAVAWSARELGCRATVFAPEDVPANKLAAMQGYGAQVTLAGRTSLDRRQAAEEFQSQNGATMVPPFDHEWIIAGQGTTGLELLEQAPKFDRLYVPIGGGGLSSGVTRVVHARRPEVTIVGVEPEGAASMAAALQAGQPVEIEVTDTVADGLRPVKGGERCLRVLQEANVRTMTVNDQAIVGAMKLLFERARLVVEPSGAASLAAYLNDDSRRPGETTVVVLSGGNVDVPRFTNLVGSFGS